MQENRAKEIINYFRCLFIIQYLMKQIFNQTKKQMRKVLLLSLIATALLSVGVSYETPAKKIASVELPKIEKSYSANVVATQIVFQNYDANVTIGVYQDDVYYSETTSVDNYTLPIIEEVFIEPTAPVPLIAA